MTSAVCARASSAWTTAAAICAEPVVTACKSGGCGALPGAAQQPSRLLVVDLTEVSYFGSAGLNAMLDCRDEAAAQDVTMTLVAKHPVVTRPIEVTGLGDVLPVHPTVAAALEGTGPPG